MCLGIYYNADICAACSSEAGKALFGKKFEKSNKKLIIRNAIECEKFVYNVDSRRILRREWKLEENNVVLGCVGSFKPQKNHDFLIDVFYSTISRF